MYSKFNIQIFDSFSNKSFNENSKDFIIAKQIYVQYHQKKLLFIKYRSQYEYYYARVKPYPFMNHNNFH